MNTAEARAGWTDDRIETLKSMWLAGKGAPAIMKVLGLPKGAVIGKAHRLGLSGLGVPTRQPPRPVAPRPVTRVVAVRPKTPRPAPPPPRPVVDEDGRLEPFEIPDPVAAEGVGEPISLVDLEARRCKYPVNAPPNGHAEDTLFCGGRTAEGAPYCRAHAVRCYSAGGLAKLGGLARIDRNVRAPGRRLVPIDGDEAETPALDRLIA